MDFTEYAIKESKEAVTARQAFPAEVQKILTDVMWDLADRPHFYPERTSIVGGATVYKHPDPAIEITFTADDAGKILYLLHYAAPLPPRRTVFISYSHQDQQWILFLKKFLTVLEDEGAIKFWDDSQIRPGERWDDSIGRALDSAKAAVLLVSQDFLTSDFIRKCELPRLLAAAEKSGTKIFWIPVSPSTVFQTHKEIAAFQSPLSDPHLSLEELPEPARKKAGVEISLKVQQALTG